MAGAPVALSFAPDHPGQRHTFAAGGRVYEAERAEVRVDAPDGAKVDPVRNVLCWGGPKAGVKSTAREVFDMADTRASGFRLAE